MTAEQRVFYAGVGAGLVCAGIIVGMVLAAYILTGGLP